MADDAVACGAIQALPQRYIAAVMSALAETAIEFVRQDRENADAYRISGFEMLWAGVVRKR